MKKRKVLVISVGLWPPAIEVSGMSAVYRITKLLARKSGFEVHILSNFSKWSKGKIKESRLPLHFVRADNLFLIWILFFTEALKLHKKYQFDIIHVYSASPSLIYWTGVLGKLCRCKTLHTVCAVNEIFPWTIRLPSNPERANRIIYTSRHLNLEGANTYYIPLGVDTTKFKPHTRIFQSKILFLGSLDKRKGAPLLIKAAKQIITKHPTVRFLIASYGKEVRDPYYQENREALEKSTTGLERNIEFIEGKHDVPQLMSKVDIFVLPAISLHGTLSPPITLIEAMSAGKACVVTDICQGDGLVEDGINCLLFRSGDVKDLIKKLNLLLSNEKLREEITKNARQKVIEQFDINKVVENLLKLYDDILR